MEIIAFPTPNLGFRNQLLGAVRAISELRGIKFENTKCFLLPPDVSDIEDFADALLPSKFKDYKTFRSVIFSMLDRHLKQDKIVPKVMVMVYDKTESVDSGRDLDLTARAVKEYYTQHQLGTILTAVVSSCFYKYKWIDIVNIPKFLLTFYSRMRLFESRTMRNKTLVTIGIINNFTPTRVQEEKSKLVTRLTSLRRNNALADQVNKIKAFTKADKKVVFCLGGRVEGYEILFDLSGMSKLLAYAERLSKKNYAVLFVNGPRTPNDVIDFLYEKVKDHPSIVFHNCKRLATNENSHNNWRLYSGKYEQEFKVHEKIGNIYPAVIGFNNTLVVHTMDTYAACETSSAALPTAIVRGIPYVDERVRYDCYNLYDLLCPRYAVDLDNFVDAAEKMNLEPNHLQLCVLSNPMRVFAEIVINRLNGLQK